VPFNIIRRTSPAALLLTCIAAHASAVSEVSNTPPTGPDDEANIPTEGDIGPELRQGYDANLPAASDGSVALQPYSESYEVCVPFGNVEQQP
jgi:hypothetical protein